MGDVSHAFLPQPRVAVVGAASWNHLIRLDHLPAPTPHMQFATGSVHTIGGTSAGKALHLAGRGIPTRLHALLGRDADGDRIAYALEESGVDLVRHASGETERHVNLMTDAGERVSLYVSTPTTPSDTALTAVAADIARAEIAVIDLAEFGMLLLERDDLGDTPRWVDLHDYNGTSAFHEPFVRAADVVFMNGDATDDPWALMASCLARGPRLAVCTLGAAGAIAVDAAGTRYEVAADPADIVDTNGAGDAFMAGFLAAHLAGAETGECLAAGSAQAVVALESEHLHPALDRVL